MTYYDRAGQVIDIDTWTQKFASKDYQIIKQEHVNGWFVSTVWLGIDHGFWGGPPQIFETMTFAPDSEAGEKYPDLDQWQDRYSTEEDAKTGHEVAVMMVREATS